MPRVRGMHGKRLDDAIERVESLVARVLRGIARTVASLVGGSPSTAALSEDDLQVIRREWATAVNAEVVPALAEAYHESAEVLAKEFADAGRPVEPVSLDAPDTADFLDAATNRLVEVSDTLWNVARKELADGVRAGEGVEELAARLQEAGGFGLARARMIARTEVVAAANAASLAQALRLADPDISKEWLATMDAGGAVCDERTRAAHCATHEQVQLLGEPFQVGETWLMYPGQPIGPADTVINCRCSIGYLVGDDMDEPLTAAAQVHTGAMVALRPSVEDAKRLAVDGGEPADQLHTTLAYLGAAADIPAESQERIIDAIRQVAEGVPSLTVEGFAVSAFNPGDTNDRDPCIVLGLSGDGLDDIHGHVIEVLLNLQSEPAGFTMPEQHAPWQPHVTLVYTDDVSMVEQLADRVGPVTFDAIRVAFAGEVTDIPLASVPEADEEGSEDFDGAPGSWGAFFAARIAEFVASDKDLRQYWVHGEGAGKIRWGTEGDFRRCVRQLDQYVRDPEGLCAEYHHEALGVWPGEKKDAVAESEDALAAATGRADAAVPAEALPGEHFRTRVLEGVSTGMRQFAPGAITWRDPPFAYHWQYKSSAHGGMPETVQVGLITRAERDGDTVHFFGKLDLRSPEGLDYARRLVEGFARWSSVGPDESVKDQYIDVEYVLADDGDLVEDPEIDLMTFRQYRVAEVTAVSVPALADATVEPTQELLDTLTAMGVLDVASSSDESQPAPDEVAGFATAGAGMPDADLPAPDSTVIVAAGHTITIPDVPPAEWFADPSDVDASGALTVTDEGRLYGYLAPAGVAHRSFRNRRVEVPMGNVDYGRWMGGEAIVAGGGRVVAGPITMNCGHMPPTASSDPGARMEHYDNTCSVVAHAAIGENDKGVWVAGALLPGVTADQISRMLACRLSGDWAPHPEKPGWREFVAALLVPVPGFPMARSAPSTLKIAEGALVAAAVPVQLAAEDEMEELMEPDETAAFAEGDRVRVLDPRDPEVTEGEIVTVHMGPAYALRVPGRDEPYRWLVAEELELAETPAEDAENAEVVEVAVASTGPDLGPALEFVARKVGRDPASRMAALRNRVHQPN